MKKKNFTYMVCTECKKIYKFDFLMKTSIAIGLLAYGFATFILLLNEYSLSGLLTEPITLSLVLLTYIVGLILIIDVSKKERNCNVCNGKKTQIPLDTPEAIEIIKENNLTFPEKSEPKEENKQPWQA